MTVFRRIIGHTLVAAYLLITLSAFVFTLSRIEPPFGRAAMITSFAMMAPFQGYSTEVIELSAEGRRADGTRVDIDLSPYYPTTYGERLTRGYLNMFRVFYDDNEGLIAYERISQLIREREYAKGNDFALVRTYWTVWPMSPDGLFALRKPPFVRKGMVTLNKQ